MNYRDYFTMFKNEPDILTVPDAIRILKLGRNTVYKLLRKGSIQSVKMGKKIIIPKTCLIEFLADEKNYRVISRITPINHWTSMKKCGIVGVSQESTQKENDKKGA